MRKPFSRKRVDRKIADLPLFTMHILVLGKDYILASFCMNN